MDSGPDRGTFCQHVGKYYDEIRKNFKACAGKNNIQWSEDILHDAFISCNNTLKDKIIDKKEAIKYYWVAYVNKYRTQMSKQKKFDSIEDLTELDDEELNLECGSYNNIPDKIYDIIMSGVQDQFGLRIAYIWDLYTCRGYSSKELREMGFDFIQNFVYFSKSIKRYIKHHIIPQNAELQELIKCNNYYM
jgi:hypothetical protein